MLFRIVSIFQYLDHELTSSHRIALWVYSEWAFGRGVKYLKQPPSEGKLRISTVACGISYYTVIVQGPSSNV